MKKILGFAALFILLAVGIPRAYALDWTLSDEKYLIDDDMYYTSGTAGGDGWDVHEVGGNVFSGWSRYFLEDTSINLSVDATRKFKQVSSGKVELEYRFYFVKDIEGFTWQVRNGEQVAVNLKTKEGGIYVQKPDGTDVFLRNYTVDPSIDGAVNKDNVWLIDTTGASIGVRVSMDLDNKKYSVYMNGALVAQDIPMPTNVIDNVYLRSPEKSTGKIYLYPLRLYRNYVLNETFISTIPGTKTVPSYMQTDRSGGTVEVENIKSQQWFDWYSLRMKANGTGTVSYAKDVEINDNLIAFEFYVIDTDGTGGFSAKLGDSMNITLNGGNFNFNGTPFYNGYRKNLWYRIKVIADYSKGLCDLYVNDIKRGENIALGGSGKGRVSFESLPGAVMNVAIDDITIYRVLPEPEDYVPVPKKAETELDLGMMVCSLWRTAKTPAWDRVKPYPERRPVLGYYDEGNPEVNDWEIKYMAEHGIDFEIFCWYKPEGSEGQMIKTPTSSYAIDGLKRSKYANMMKYCIIWENKTAHLATMQDFKENLVPFWIENYFKDPNYYTIDGKPVFTIHEINAFIRQLDKSQVDEAGYAKVKEAIAYLKSECEKAGLGGCIVMTNNGGGTNFDITKADEIGLDAVYTYGFGSNGASPEYVKMMSKSYVDTGVDYIGLASQGFDSYPWSGNRGLQITYDDFEDVCRWLRDDFTKNLANGKYGRNVVTFDNWNEYGEGHILAPTDGDGFNYLDIIKKVFSKSQQPCDDIAPTQAQQDRIQILYDQTRKGYKLDQGLEVTKYPTKVVKGWYFDNGTENWYTNSYFTNFNSEEGAMHAVSTNTDPQFYSPKFEIDASSVSYIKVRFKRTTNAAPMSEFFFTTDSNPKWHWQWNYLFSSTGGEYCEYYIDVSKNPRWTGKITNLRFDPFDSLGEVWVDSIEFLGDLEEVENSVVVDGKIEPIAPIKKECGAFLPLVDTLKTFTDTTFDWNTDGAEDLQFKIGDNEYIVNSGETKFNLNGKDIDVCGGFYMEGEKMYASADFFRIVMGATGLSYSEDTNTLYISVKRVDWSVYNDGLKDWTANENFYNKNIGKGSISFKTRSYEAALTSPSDIGIKAGRFSNIKIKYKNATATSYIKVYYKTKDMADWDSQKVTYYSVKPNSNKMIEYTVPLDWSGPELDQIKVVFSNKIGGVEIESIKLEY